MPLVHERTFRIRHYECDAYGHVNNTNYLRYMQEAAFDASAAAGYSPARYEQMGQHWLVRETEVEYLNPLRYGDSVVVRTWVEDFRRVRSRRAYELRVDASGELAARGATDWVYVDSATGQPARIPSDLIAAFFPEGAPASAPPRPPFPELPAPPPGMFVMPRKVQWQDIDTAGHVNNAQYLAFISDCAFEVATAHGWPAARMLAAGMGIVVRRHHIEYRQQARMDERLEVATWLYGARRATVNRAFRITRAADGALMAQAHVKYVWINLASGQPMRISDEIMRDFAGNLAA